MTPSTLDAPTLRRAVDPARLRSLCADLVSIRSPTGEEHDVAEYCTGVLAAAGYDASTERLDRRSSNSVAGAARGRPGAPGAPTLLLYSPIDTVLSGDPAEDLPGAGPVHRDDMRPVARHDGPLVVGLGAHNPKGHAACVLHAAEVLAPARGEVAGRLAVGIGGQGMPTNARRSDLAGGHGSGCARIAAAVRPSEAIIAKSGWAVSWAEVGLTWHRISVHGTHTYVGSRHLLPYRNAIVGAGIVARELDDWFADRAAATGDDLVSPQGVVAAVEGGWTRMPAFTPARCDLYVDLRIAPATAPEQARRELDARLADIAARHGLDVTSRPLLAIPGTCTPPDHRVVAAAVDAWEQVTGSPHRPVRGTSGSTDANILRAHGVPTARVGLPKADLPDADFELGMNAVAVADMVRLTQLLVTAAVTVLGPRDAGGPGHG